MVMCMRGRVVLVAPLAIYSRFLNCCCSMYGGAPMHACMAVATHGMVGHTMRGVFALHTWQFCSNFSRALVAPVFCMENVSLWRCVQCWSLHSPIAPSLKRLSIHATPVSALLSCSFFSTRTGRVCMCLFGMHRNLHMGMTCIYP